MLQVLFTVPILQSWFPPDGIPVYGFGAMLFVTFIATTMWGARRGKAAGMPPEKVQDLAIVVFVSGIVGARILYMIQYANQFHDQSAWGLFLSFFQIWKGGIIFYGSALGGAIGYGLFYWYVMRRLNVSGWKLADSLAPVIALGLAIGRIGCYLNGCCWGQVAVEETCPVPLGGAHFPLLPAHARDQLVRERGLQTTTGFTVKDSEEERRRAERSSAFWDPRTVVLGVEPGSPAEAAGLKAGDRIVKVNGRANAVVVRLSGASEAEVGEALKFLDDRGATVDAGATDKYPRAYFDSPIEYDQAIGSAREKFLGVRFVTTDQLGDLVADWPRGQHELALGVNRDGTTVDVVFVPRSVALYPTQLYETVSMGLLVLLLLAYHPFRRHDGQGMVLLMVGYSLHRFINESIRIEPTIGLGLTLSQWGSVVIFLAAVGIEVYLWRVMPSRWASPEPPAPATGQA